MVVERAGRRCARGALALAALTLLALPARAEPHDVLIIGDSHPDLARKLRAEAAYAGFRPLERAPGAGRRGGAPGEGAPGSAAPATLRVLSRERVALTVDGLDGERRFEQTLVASPGERDAFALRVVEQLRARLVDVGWTLPEEPAPASAGSDASAPAEAAPGDAPSPTASAALPATDRTELGGADGRGRDDGAFTDAGAESRAPAGAGRAGRVWLDAGVGSSWASGGLGAVPHAALGAALELGAGWQARATSLWPLRDATLEESEGQASVTWTGFTATLAADVGLPRPWLAQAGLGGGLLVLDARGDARADFSGRRERLYAGAYFAELAFGRELSSWLRLRATAWGGLTAPRPVLRFDEREVASLGRFIGALTLGLDLSWPTAEAR